jgi:hypothetical protein
MRHYPEYSGHSVIFSGDPETIAREHPEAYGNGECVALVRALTSIGPHSTWIAGPKVKDLIFLPQGTVVANFEFVNGIWQFGNRHGFHAGIACYKQGFNFVELGQWRNRKGNAVQLRTVVSRGGTWPNPCDDADQYHVVLI